MNGVTLKNTVLYILLFKLFLFDCSLSLLQKYITLLYLLRHAKLFTYGRSGHPNPVERDSPYPSKLALGPTQPSVKWVSSLFPADKVARAWR